MVNLCDCRLLAELKSTTLLEGTQSKTTSDIHILFLFRNNNILRFQTDTNKPDINSFGHSLIWLWKRLLCYTWRTREMRKCTHVLLKLVFDMNSRCIANTRISYGNTLIGMMFECVITVKVLNCSFEMLCYRIFRIFC